MLNYKKSESTIRPDEVDTTSSNSFVYLRRNIIGKQRKDETSGETQTYYEYDEAKMGKEEYKEYLKGLALIDIEQQRADIDYLAIMAGVEL